MNNKILMVSIDSAISPSTKVPYEGVVEAFTQLTDSGDIIVFMSRTYEKLQLAKSVFKDETKYKFPYRKDAKKFVEKYPGGYFVVLGSNEQDLYLAANNRQLLINPMWSEVKTVEIEKYGIKISHPALLVKFIEIIKNQSSWYYNADLGDSTHVLSLYSANTYIGSHTKEEKALVAGFQSLLKEGDKRYYEVLLYHFLAGIANNDEFREVQDWAIFPSSGTELNKDMLQFKERARIVMNGRKAAPLFIRHTPTRKSRGMEKTERIPCDRHFDTVILNESYKGKLKGRTVCVLDDFLTNGTSFETARNLLLTQNVKKIIFVSVGRFGTNYFAQYYKINGDVFSPGYSYELLKRLSIVGSTNTGAIEEINSLYRIIYGIKT
ncbi:hypothetical protein JCM17380_16800 [Desulfosporosinus burensis]